MLNPQTFMAAVPELQRRYWPHVNVYEHLDPDFQTFLLHDVHQQRRDLEMLRQHPERHGHFLHEALSTCFAYRYSYRDSPCYRRTDESFETQLMQAELVLGDELLTHGLDVTPPPRHLSHAEAAAYVRQLAQDNAGVAHPLFDYLATTASQHILEITLYLETIRNEVVDDEVAHLAVGLQGLMKAVAASNLWDECGYGKPVRFHTYWLRRLVERLQGWEALAAYRQVVPWFTRIMSNAFNTLLWRPAYTYRKYGYFLITESWVAPHFDRIIAGLQRVGLDHKDVSVYFKAHLTIDPHHGEELVDGFAYQQPSLSQDEIDDVLLGAHIAIAAGVMQCDYVLPYLVQMT